MNALQGIQLTNSFQNRWARLLKDKTPDDFCEDLIKNDHGQGILPIIDIIVAVRDNEEAERDIYRHFRNTPVDSYLENGGDVRDIPNPIPDTDIREEQLPF